MSTHRKALQAAIFFALLTVSSQTLAQVGGPAQEGDRDASSTEDGPSLGQSQQNQTKSQQQQKNDAGRDLRQNQTGDKDNRQDRSTPRAERPPRQDRPMKLERFHK